MAQRLTTATINTNVPGAYPNVNVKSSPAGIVSTGIITIIGEAAGGADFSAEDLKNNFFGPDQFDRVRAKYISGPVVEAMRALSVPSDDTLITGSPNRIYIVKTNQGAKAQKVIDTDYGTILAKNFGFDGNKIKITTTASQLEAAPEVSGITILAFGAALDEASFTIRQNGGAATVITLSAVPADHSNQATLIVELNSLLPVGVTASAGAAANSIKLTMAADAANYRKGWGKSLELFDSTSGDLALLGLTAGLTKSSAESQVEFSVSRTDINLNETLLAKGEVALEIGYQGTTATLTISGSTLTTTVTGGSGANLSIDLNQYTTIADLADFINLQTGYKASVVTGSVQLAPSALDKVSAIGICSSSASVKAGRIKKSLQNFKNALANSAATDFTATATSGLPTPEASSFLSGGLKGATSNATILAALEKIEGIQTNFVVPLFSRDASADIADALTESSSSYTIDSINAAAKSHALKMSTQKMKKNRLAVLSYSGTFIETQDKAQALSSFRSAMTFQKVSQTSDTGVQLFLPWYGACIAAGMQAAGFYRSVVNKKANLISFVDPSDFDSGSPTDLETALDAGLLILQQSSDGVRWVSDQSTYGYDTNFVYNSIQTTYLSDIAALDLADSLGKKFVGQSLADISAATAKAFVAEKMEQYKRIKIITSSDDAVLGYKNLKVPINGPVMEISLEIKLSTSVYFIPINIEISQVQQTAGA
jgi:hypothetical protein